MGLEVYGPHPDRAVDIEALIASGRIQLQKKNNRPLIKETIIIKKIY